MFFVKLTNYADHAIYVNLAQVITMERYGNETTLIMNGRDKNDHKERVLVKETPEQIVGMIQQDRISQS
jgi:uncharacterized protein YpmB